MTSYKNPRNIIFDLGGVLLNIDYRRTTEAFGKLGLAAPEEAFSKYRQASLFREFEKGTVSAQAFLQKLSEKIPDASSNDLKQAWCALLGHMPAASFKLLEKLRKGGYGTYLLSNTNEIHKEAFEKHIEEVYGIQKFLGLFDRVYYSHEMGIRKPDAAAFRTVLQENGLAAEETVFTDDTEEHVAAALGTGIRALHLKDITDLPAMLREAGFEL